MRKIDSSYVYSPENKHIDAHEALKPDTTKDILENKEEDSVDTILFWQSDNVVWDEEPIDATVIWHEEEPFNDTVIWD
jgi:hypothetical protein